MTLVRLFAAAAEAAGTDEVTLGASPVAAQPSDDETGPSDAAGHDFTLGALRSALADSYGAEFARVLRRCAVLVDGERLDDDDPVPAGATVDILPPFAGG